MFQYYPNNRIMYTYYTNKIIVIKGICIILYYIQVQFMKDQNFKVSWEIFLDYSFFLQGPAGMSVTLHCIMSSLYLIYIFI